MTHAESFWDTPLQMRYTSLDPSAQYRIRIVYAGDNFSMNTLIRLVANGRIIEYWRDGTRVFHLEDAAPYESGWFALRTTYSHLRISHLRIRRIS